LWDLSKTALTGLFAMVADDLPGATYALVSGSDEVLGVLAEREHVIDVLYREIETVAAREILLQASVASDLRFLLSVVRVVPELERSHDLVMQIPSRAGRVLGDDLSPASRSLIERMGDVAAVIWRQAADSWRHRDRSVAMALSRRHDQMNELHAGLMAELAPDGWHSRWRWR
jgi:phosphate transport system protein